MMDILKQSVKEIIPFYGRKEKKGAFQIALTGTDNYIPYIGLAMTSVHHYNPDMSISFHLFLNALPDIERKRLQEFTELSGDTVYVHLMNDDAFQSLIFGEKTPVFFYRFVVTDLLKDYGDRVLYMDGDIMCRGSLKELVEMDLGNALAAVVSDRGAKKQMRQIGVSEGFFNAGVMLIHSKLWVQENIFDKVIAMAKDSLTKIDAKGHYAGWHGLKYNDQNILNVILDGRRIWLPRKYNYIYQLQRTSVFTKPHHNDDFKKQILLHFAGNMKPWAEWVQQRPVACEYRKLWLASPWRDIPLSAPKGKKQFHDAAREYRKRGNYGEWLYWYLKYLRSKV